MRKNEMPVYTSRRRNGKHKTQKRRFIKPLIVILAAVLMIFGLLLILLGFFSNNKSLNGNEENFPGKLFGYKKSGPPYTIAVDAGHGGSDVGAQGIIDEVELTERTAKILFALLEANPDFKPILCRDYGQGAAPAQRARVANKAKADMLISIHGNSDESGSSYGFECFPAPPGRKWHNESKYFAGIVAQEMQSQGARLRGDDGVRYVYYNENSEKVFIESSDTTEYELPSFSVVDKSDCPAVLVEQCFINNEDDLRLFGTEEGCQKAAECYYRAITSYFNANN